MTKYPSIPAIFCLFHDFPSPSPSPSPEPDPESDPEPESRLNFKTKPS